MKLFNKLYLFIFVALAFACDPYEETFQEIEESTPGPIANIEITLNDDDYALLEDVEGAESIVQYGNFDNEEDVREFIPRILSQKYPLFDNKSLVTVNYDYYRGFPSEVRPFSNADEFSFGADEYALISDDAANFQFVNSKSDVFDVLSESNPDAEDGDVLIVGYKYADISYEGINFESIFLENFQEASDLSAHDTYSLEGDQVWELDGSRANMSGYDGSNMPNEDWLVVSEIDLTDASSSVALRISQGINFKNDAVYGEDIAIKVSTDYDGTNVETANWENLDVQNWPAGSNWDLVDSEASLADYAGETISIGFYYRSTTDFAPNWDINEISVEFGETIETETIETFYQFEDDSWTIPGDAYYLTTEDYDEMGAPGQYNNFSGDVPPADYLPELLNQKYPYAIEEDQKIVVYKYFSSGEVQTRGDLYTFKSENWEVYGSTIVEQLQFAKEEGVWVPDNTIAYTLTGEDYELIGDIAIENGDVARGENLQQYGNFYQNFPGGDTHWTDEQIVAVLDQFLKIKYPDLGPGQKFTITYAAYTGSAVELQMNLIQNEEGNYVIND
ncbi:MAG: choice-of-anchor J domain-containing protein [Bacteroidota bacterium]